ncbi:hypothetical protein EV421DRAFT_1807870 [Armillaria borealis]|uniref:Uncharacterized protein n=1 Tax=Armillaria borealis TaxID=47425 RepID=A0AA39JH76_9AGAR|nr:hypothetical protein EV421DRAFT_1807870 [Armillaria borealis]
MRHMLSMPVLSALSSIFSSLIPVVNVLMRLLLAMYSHTTSCIPTCGLSPCDSRRRLSTLYGSTLDMLASARLSRMTCMSCSSI